MSANRKDKGHDPRPTQRARELRNNPTPAERRLWSVLSNRQIAGVRFNRQVKVPPFTVDLCARMPKLVVELDGGQHGEAIAYDERRTKFLEARGYKVIRFWNHEVMNCLDDVVRVIQIALSECPSRSAGGDGERSEPGEGMSDDEGDIPSPRRSAPFPSRKAGGAK